MAIENLIENVDSQIIKIRTKSLDVSFNELYDMYQEMCQMTGAKAIRLVGSGNGIRRNSLMQELAEKLFGMKMNIPVCQEEAAFGAALHSLVSAGLAESLELIQQKIQYL